MEDALSGSGEEDQMARLSAYREAWAPRGKSLVMSSTNRMKRTGPSTEPLSDAEGTAAGMTYLDFSSTVKKKRAYSNNEASGEFEQSARPSRKPWRSQQMPKWFGLEAFSFGSRPRLVETELEFVERRPTRTKAGLACGKEMIEFEVKS